MGEGEAVEAIAAGLEEAHSLNALAVDRHGSFRC
jgi:hypothetical protein